MLLLSSLRKLGKLGDEARRQTERFSELRRGHPPHACQSSRPCATLQHSIPYGASEQTSRPNPTRRRRRKYPVFRHVQLLKRLGFQERIKGGHHIFFRDGVAEILNLQPHAGKCKPYQVKQVRNVIINYRLAGEADA